MNKWNAIYLSLAFIAIAVFFVGEQKDGSRTRGAPAAEQSTGRSGGSDQDRQLASSVANEDWYASASGGEDDYGDDEGFDYDGDQIIDPSAGSRDESIRENPRPASQQRPSFIVVPGAPPPVLSHSGARIRPVGRDMIER